MRHKYYGVEVMPNLDLWHLERWIRDLEIDLEYSSETTSTMDKQRLETYLEILNHTNGIRRYAVANMPTFNECFIEEKRHEHVCNTGDTVIVGGREGKVKDAKYDVENDTMHCYTDIQFKVENEKLNDDDYIKSQVKPLLERAERMANNLGVGSESPSNDE